MAKTSIVDDVTDSIALQIAAGVYGPGTKLPSVRNLAAEHHINPSTVQVVLARLEGAGFGEAHQGVGFIVRDIRLYGGIETWRYLFRFARQLPDLATKMLADMLATRRMTVGEAVHAIAEHPDRYDPAPVRQAVQQFELLAAHQAGIEHLARAEVHAVRMTVAATGQGVALAVFNSVGELLLEVPEVLQAMYADIELHVMAWQVFLTGWEARTITREGIDLMEQAIAERDTHTIGRFKDLITKKPRRSR